MTALVAPPVSFADIAVARQRIAGAVLSSPCPESIPLSEATGSQIFCKLENLQRTGSFKERGARNALLLLPPEQARRGVIAASAGNHALGLAYHGGLLGVPVTVCMPEFAPLVKASTCRRLGARVIQHGRDFAQAREKADELAAAEGLAYVHGYDDPAIIAGQGTIGLELVEQVLEFDALVIPVGGGGLLAGVALAVKTLRPKVKIYGVEPEGATCFAEAMRRGHSVPCQTSATLADGLAVPEAGANAFAVAAPLLDGLVTVTEDEIALAILRIVELEKLVVEGAGASGLAALLAGKLPQVRGQRVVLPFCGGNIDPVILSRVIEKGLAADGRLARFEAVISDRPGGLARLTRLLAEAGASVRQVEHDRAFGRQDVFAVRVRCEVETRGREHLEDVVRRLKAEGIRVTAI